MSTVRIQLRRGTESEWLGSNPVLSLGEVGISTNTYQLKIGDGIRRWNELPFVTKTEAQIEQIVQDLTALINGAEAASIPLIEKGEPSGVAELDADGYVPDTQISPDIARVANVNAQVESAVSGIIDSAPDALNTLNELAAALGDDNNYAATVTNALSERISFVADTEANFTSNNPILAINEFAISTDTSQIKIGDGLTAWNDLDYATKTSSQIDTQVQNIYLDIMNVLGLYVQKAEKGVANGVVPLDANALILDEFIPSNIFRKNVGGVIDAPVEFLLDVSFDSAITAISIFSPSINTDTLFASSAEVSNAITAVTGEFTNATVEDSITSQVVSASNVNVTSNVITPLVTTGAILTDSINIGQNVSMSIPLSGDLLITNGNSTISISNASSTDGLVQFSNVDVLASNDLTVSGTLFISSNAEISNQPTSLLHATNKQYVDTSDTATLTSANQYTDQEISIAAGELTNYTDSSINTHNLDTTNVHGIADTQALATKTYADDAVSTAITAIKNSAPDNLDTLGEIASAINNDPNYSSTVNTAISDSLASANTYADNAVSTHNLDTTDVHGIPDTSLLETKSGAQAKADAAEAAANAYTDTRVSNLVDGAPIVLDTLNEIANAINDDANFASTVTSAITNARNDANTYTDEQIVAHNVDTQNVHGIADTSLLETQAGAQAKADAAEADANAYTDAHNLDTTNVHGIPDTQALATKTYADTSSANALSDSKTYTDGKISQEVADRNAAISSAISTEVSDRNAAISSAINTEVSDRNAAITTAINALTTSDIEEGTNLYFTDERAQDAVNAALVAGTGVSKTYNDAGNSITIDNTGVLSVAGTTGEVEVSASTGNVTIGLPNDVTIGNDLNVTGDITSVDSITFDTTYALNPTAAGQMAWDQSNETAQIKLNNEVLLQVGQEHLIRVKNASGTTAIPNMTAVMFAGSTGDTIMVAPTVSDGTYPAEYVVGITTQSIPADGFGFVTKFGFINNVDTDTPGWNAGTLLYLDPSTPGGLTSIEPQAPAIKMTIAAVTRRHAHAGRILVRTIPNGTLNDVNDVKLTTPTANDLIIFDDVQGIWKNGKDLVIDSLIISGDLVVNGTSTTVNTSSFETTDPLIYIGEGNQSNSVDLGFVSAFNDGTYQHAGLVRDASENKWKLFKGVTDEPTTTINFTQGTLDTLAVATIEGNLLGDVTGNVTGNVSGNAGTVTNGVYTTDTGTVTSQMIANETIVNADISASAAIDQSKIANLTTDLAAKLSSTTAASTYAPLASPTFTGTVTLPAGTVTSTMIADGTITNTDISESAAIAVSKLASSTISGVTLGNNLNALTIGTGLSGTSYNGSAAVTIAIDSTVATLSGTQTLTNKTLTDSTTFFQDETDNTKKLQFQLSEISTATTRTLTIPNVNGTIITSGDTGTVTNTMLAGSIANTKLVNSSLTVGTTSIALGGTATTLAGLTSVTSTAFVGELTGNASTATALKNARTINGVSFDGTANITVAADANTLTGTTLASGVVNSSLTSVGTLSSLAVSGSATIGTDLTVTGNLTVNGTTTTINSTIVAVDDIAIELGSVAAPNDTTANGGGIILKGATDKTFTWSSGTSSWASSENLSIASGKTFKINGSDVLTSTQVLGKTPGGTSAGDIATIDATQTLTNKTISGASNTITNIANSATTATSANTASAIVARDASGNFSAGTITASLTGNASTATTLQTARSINGVSFNGSADITIAAAAGTLTGDTLASGVTASSLTSLGTLTGLNVNGTTNIQSGGVIVATIGNDANGSIELGKVNGTGTTPFIDFHAGATATDYDVRMMVSGGTGTVGQGTLTITGNLVTNVNTTAKTAAYTLTRSDANTLIQVNGAYAMTIPLNSSVAYPIGTTINILALTTGASIALTSGVGAYYTPGLKLRAAGSMATLIKIGTDTWAITGDLAA